MSLAEALSQSLETGPHAVLTSMIGRWSGTGRIWLRPDVLSYEDEVTGTIEAIYDGRWVRHDYSTRIDGRMETGSALIGCYLREREWQVAWVDSWHTGTEIMVSRGPLDGAGKLVSVLGSYGAGDERWGWRTTFEPAGDTLVVRHFNITPAGEEGLAVQFDYTRA